MNNQKLSNASFGRSTGGQIIDYIDVLISFALHKVDQLRNDCPTVEETQKIVERVQFTSVMDMLSALRSDEGTKSYSELLDRFKPGQTQER